MKQILVSEIIECLDRVPCQFWACEGPDEPPKDMITCHVCQMLYGLKRGDSIEDDREEGKSL